MLLVVSMKDNDGEECCCKSSLLSAIVESSIALRMIPGFTQRRYIVREVDKMCLETRTQKLRQNPELPFRNSPLLDYCDNSILQNISFKMGNHSCAELAEEITNLRNELARRFPELRENKWDLPKVIHVVDTLTSIEANSLFDRPVRCL